MKQTFPQIEGAIPALDRKKVGKPFVVDGRNYIVDLDGPRSAFGFQSVKDAFSPSLFMQSFEIGNRILYFGRDVGETVTQISGFDWDNRQIIPVKKFISTDTTRPKLNSPWTHAFVGTYHFFANRTFGILRYDAINDAWLDVTVSFGIANVFFIGESGGRLVTLAEGITSWSAIDDGLDNTPSIITGAGFQSISLVGTLENNDDYLGLETTAKGYLSFTTKGVLRSELIDSINPFRHTPGDAKQKPLTPWCITKISDTEIVILSRLGLFISDSGLFKEWQPLMGEYLKLKEIPQLQNRTSGFIMTHYSFERDEFFVSFAQSEVLSQFTKAWVLYLKRDQWGSFNRTHAGFVSVDVRNVGTDFKQAFISANGKLHCLDDSVVSLAIESQSLIADYYQPLLQYGTPQFEGIYLMPCNVRLSGFSTLSFPQVPAYYEVNGEVECFKTEITAVEKAVTVVDSTLFGFWNVVDSSVPAISFLVDLFPSDTALTSGNTYNFDFTFRKGTSDYPKFAFDVGSSGFSLVGYDFQLNQFDVTDNLGSIVASLIDLGDDNYILRAQWQATVADSLLQSVILYPAHANSNLVTGNTYFKSFSLYDVAAPAVEIMPFIDGFTDTSKWGTANGLEVNEVADVFPCSVAVNSQLCKIGLTAQDKVKSSTDSTIEIGLFRFTDELANDQLSLITNTAISCLAMADSTADTFDDWLNDYPTDVIEDWLAITPDEFEDYGDEIASGSTYTQNIRGTLDGYETFEDQFVPIDEVLIAGKTKFCSATSAGLFQSIEISALEVGHSFYVKTLEINGNLIGRL